MAVIQATQVTVGTAAVQLIANARHLDIGMVVKAHDGNTGKIYVGFSNAVTTSTGFELGNSQGLSIVINDNAGRTGSGRADYIRNNEVWCISNAASQSVSVLTQ